MHDQRCIYRHILVVYVALALEIDLIIKWVYGELMCVYYLFILRAVAAGGAGPDEVDVGGGLLLFLGGGHGRGGGQVVLHGTHVVEAVAPCHGRRR